MSAILDLAPGIHRAIPESVYHQRHVGLVSKGALDLVHRSPAHYKAWIDGELPDEDTPALKFGRAFHCSILEPERFASTYTAEPDFGDCRFKDNKRARDDWRAEHQSFELIGAAEFEQIRGMTASVRRHPLAGKMIRDGEPESTVTWSDEDTGLRCKIRPDYYVKRLGMVADVKSTLDASWEAFRRDVVKWRYHVQDALYRAGFAGIDDSIQHFVFIAVEKEPPFAVAIYSLDADGIGRGYSAARRDIDALAECLKTNTWPGYPTGIQTLELPPWAA